MTKSLLEVLPKDKYVVLNRHKLSEIDTKVVQLLYQPLISAPAISLYFALMNELNADQMWSKPNDHYWLLDFFSINMNELLLHRKSLEGIGLLRAWRKSTDTGDNYIYEIQAPISAETFFQDEILMIFLQQKIGTKHVERLVKIFSDKKVPQDYEEITANFNDVYTPMKPDELAKMSNPDKRKKILANQFFTNEEMTYQNSFIEEFDFGLLIEVLKGNFVNRKSLTPSAMQTISVLAYLYQVTVIDMSKLILRCVNDKGVIDLAQLGMIIRDGYLKEHQHLPSLISKVQPNSYRTIVNPKTDEEHLLYAFENNSPLDVLTSVEVSNGAKPSASTLAIIENIMINQKLNPGVVNVLLHYVLQKSDNQISKNYIEQIADTLARKKIKTVQEAYDHFKKGLAGSTATAKPASKRSYGNKKDIIPSWMKEQESGKEKTDSVDIEELKKTLEQYKKGGN